jgi:nickel-dependent lactate racemase
MLLFAKGSVSGELDTADLKKGLYKSFEILGPRKKVLVIPPDFTRVHSRAGDLTRMAYKYYKKSLTDIMPALGTHLPMTNYDIYNMFGDIPKDLFRIHDWRKDVVKIGKVPSGFIREVSGNKVSFSWPVTVNKLLVKGKFDLILSIGQVVPHEVTGMANYNKNILIGTGGADSINKSHFLGAVYGMEKLMGLPDNPVRQLLNYAAEKFTGDLPIIYVHTVIAREEDNKLKVKGLYIGDDKECFMKAADLSVRLNINILEKPIKKAVVYLNPWEYKSTWLGNKSIYRTRMALGDNAELIILAPGIKEFGEDKEIDRLIRKYGYVNTPKILDLVDSNKDLRNNLSAAAHLIHGSSEDRFKIVYCTKNMSAEEIQSVNFSYASPVDMMKKYDVEKLKDGHNIVDGEEIFYISNPGLGLWASKEKYNSELLKSRQ